MYTKMVSFTKLYRNASPTEHKKLNVIFEGYMKLYQENFRQKKASFSQFCEHF